MNIDQDIRSEFLELVKSLRVQQHDPAICIEHVADRPWYVLLDLQGKIVEVHDTHVLGHDQVGNEDSDLAFRPLCVLIFICDEVVRFLELRRYPVLVLEGSISAGYDDNDD